MLICHKTQTNSCELFYNKLFIQFFFFIQQIKYNQRETWISCFSAPFTILGHTKGNNHFLVNAHNSTLLCVCNRCFVASQSSEGKLMNTNMIWKDDVIFLGKKKVRYVVTDKNTTLFITVFRFPWKSFLETTTKILVVNSLLSVTQPVIRFTGGEEQGQHYDY